MTYERGHLRDYVPAETATRVMTSEPPDSLAAAAMQGALRRYFDWLKAMGLMDMDAQFEGFWSVPE